MPTNSGYITQQNPLLNTLTGSSSNLLYLTTSTTEPYVYMSTDGIWGGTSGNISTHYDNTPTFYNMPVVPHSYAIYEIVFKTRPDQQIFQTKLLYKLITDVNTKLDKQVLLDVGRQADKAGLTYLYIKSFAYKSTAKLETSIAPQESIF